MSEIEQESSSKPAKKSSDFVSSPSDSKSDKSDAGSSTTTKEFTTESSDLEVTTTEASNKLVELAWPIKTLYEKDRDDEKDKSVGYQVDSGGSKADAVTAKFASKGSEGKLARNVVQGEPKDVQELPGKVAELPGSGKVADKGTRDKADKQPAGSKDESKVEQLKTEAKSEIKGERKAAAAVAKADTQQAEIKGEAVKKTDTQSQTSTQFGEAKAADAATKKSDLSGKSEGLKPADKSVADFSGTVSAKQKDVTSFEPNADPKAKSTLPIEGKRIEPNVMQTKDIEPGTKADGPKDKAFVPTPDLKTAKSLVADQAPYIKKADTIDLRKDDPLLQIEKAKADAYAKSSATKVDGDTYKGTAKAEQPATTLEPRGEGNITGTKPFDKGQMIDKGELGPKLSQKLDTPSLSVSEFNGKPKSGFVAENAIEKVPAVHVAKAGVDQGDLKKYGELKGSNLTVSKSAGQDLPPINKSVANKSMDYGPTHINSAKSALKQPDVPILPKKSDLNVFNDANYGLKIPDKLDAGKQTKPQGDYGAAKEPTVKLDAGKTAAIQSQVGTFSEPMKLGSVPVDKIKQPANFSPVPDKAASLAGYGQKSEPFSPAKKGDSIFKDGTKIGAPINKIETGIASVGPIKGKTDLAAALPPNTFKGDLGGTRLDDSNIKKAFLDQGLAKKGFDPGLKPDVKYNPELGVKVNPDQSLGKGISSDHSKRLGADQFAKDISGPSTKDLKLDGRQFTDAKGEPLKQIGEPGRFGEINKLPGKPDKLGGPFEAGQKPEFNGDTKLPGKPAHGLDSYGTNEGSTKPGKPGDGIQAKPGEKPGQIKSKPSEVANKPAEKPGEVTSKPADFQTKPADVQAKPGGQSTVKAPDKPLENVSKKPDGSQPVDKPSEVNKPATKPADTGTPPSKAETVGPAKVGNGATTRPNDVAPPVKPAETVLKPADANKPPQSGVNKPAEGGVSRGGDTGGTKIPRTGDNTILPRTVDGISRPADRLNPITGKGGDVVRDPVKDYEQSLQRIKQLTADGRLVPNPMKLIDAILAQSKEQQQRTAGVKGQLAEAELAAKQKGEVIEAQKSSQAKADASAKARSVELKGEIQVKIEASKQRALDVTNAQVEQQTKRHADLKVDILNASGKLADATAKYIDGKGGEHGGKGEPGVKGEHGGKLSAQDLIAAGKRGGEQGIKLPGDLGGKIPLSGSIKVNDLQPVKDATAGDGKAIADITRPGMRGFGLNGDGKVQIAKGDGRTPLRGDYRYITGLELALIMSLAGIAKMRGNNAARLEGRIWGITRQAGKPVILVDGRRSPFAINRGFGNVGDGSFRVKADARAMRGMSTLTMKNADTSKLTAKDAAGKLNLGLLGKHTYFNYFQGRNGMASDFYAGRGRGPGTMGLAFIMAASGMGKGALGPGMEQPRGDKVNMNQHGPADRIRMNGMQNGLLTQAGRFNFDGIAGSAKAASDKASEKQDPLDKKEETTLGDLADFLARLDEYAQKKEENENETDGAAIGKISLGDAISQLFRDDTDEESVENAEEDSTTNATTLTPILRRPRWVVQVGQTLDGIAEAIFGNSDYGWLIADLNRHVMRETYADGRRIVELNSRQEIELPVHQDIEKFNLARKKGQNAENLITIVVERQIEKEVVDTVLKKVIGAEA